MTRQELIQIIERKISEQEAELQIDKQALAVLRRAQRSGPIVYGNGHHDGKKPKAVRPQGVKGLTADKIMEILKGHPLGMTLVEIQAALAKQGIEILPSGVYDSLRRQHVKGMKRPGIQPMYYKIQPKELQPK